MSLGLSLCLLTAGCTALISGRSDGGNSSGSATDGGTGNCKRGLAYGSAAPADQAALVPGIGWWYNWSPTPESAVESTYAELGLEFVPMQWGGTIDTTKLAAEIPVGAKYLLGFNEPNFVEQSDLTPQQAAALWPQLEAVAQARGLKLVSPAVNFCGPASACINQDTSPFDWLDAFLAACTGCQVDYIAVHIYLQDGSGLQSVLSQYEAKYSQQLWVTEWANLGTTVSAADELELMQQALPILEADPHVFRYAWFTGRSPAQPSLDLLAPDAGVLTPLGEAYVTGIGSCVH
ncbi:MAG: glycoside hydrolase family protein [Myxococcaceae bacterium]